MAFTWPVRVYLEDTDAQGVVYNASYFRFMERARTELLRDRGIDHDEVRERFGIAFVLSAIEARFRSAAKLSDLLAVGADVVEVRGARIVFAQSIRREERAPALVCEGRAEVACMDAVEARPRRLPRELLEGLMS
jgi:acyl-CoA thioester hydrolase